MIDLSGKRIGRYKLLEKRGEGGMAVVYRALDTRLQREVAVKIIRLESFAPAVVTQMARRFEREARSLAQLDHPNIIPIHDSGDFNGAPYLVMKFIPGGTLKDLAGQPMPHPQAARLLVPVARALDYAHRREIIHRDVKPGNILLAQDGTPMLSDFGVAKFLEEEEGNTLTNVNMGVGTPEYMAPEQWSNQISAQTDIYSLGVVFYELVTGCKPYTAPTPAALAIKQATEPVPDPARLVHGLPEAARKTILKALEKRPQDRFASMADFANELEKLAAAEAPRPKKEAAPADRPPSPGKTKPVPATPTGPPKTPPPEETIDRTPPPMLPPRRLRVPRPVLALAAAALGIAGLAAAFSFFTNAAPGLPALPLRSFTATHADAAVTPTTPPATVTATESISPTVTSAPETATPAPSPTLKPTQAPVFLPLSQSNAAGLKLVDQWSPTPGQINQILFDSTQNRLVIGIGNKEDFWSRSINRVSVLNFPDKSYISAISDRSNGIGFSQDESLLFTGRKVVDSGTFKVVFEFDQSLMNPDAEQKISSPDGRYIAFGVDSHAVRVYHFGTSNLYRNVVTTYNLNAFTNAPALQFSPGSHEIAIRTTRFSSEDRATRVELFSIETIALDEEGTNRVIQVNSQPLYFTYSPDQTLFAVIFDQTVEIRDTKNLYTILYSFPGSQVAFSPDSRLIAAAIESQVVLYTAAGEAVHHFEVESGDITSLCFSPDQTYLLVGTANGDLYIFRVME